jgi:hypothetical protein
VCGIEHRQHILWGTIPQSGGKSDFMNNTAEALPAILLEPFGDFSEARITIDYRDEPRRCGGGLYNVPHLVLLEYPKCP